MRSERESGCRQKYGSIYMVKNVCCYFHGFDCACACLFVCCVPDYYFLLIGKVLRFTTGSFRPIVLPFDTNEGKIGADYQQINARSKSTEPMF